MAAAGLSRYFQSPLNAVVTRRCPPRLTRRWLHALGRLYFRRYPGERGRFLEGFRGVHRGRGRVALAGLERQVLAGVCEHYFEKLLMAYWDRERISRFLLRRVHLVHPGRLDGALAQGRGAILTTGHYGAVEFLPAFLGLRGYPVSMVVMYKTARLKRALEEFAAVLGVELIDAGEGPVMPRALAALRRGRVFITELDELKHWRPAAAKVMRLFGRRVRLDRTVELLHRRTGAPVLLGLMERAPRGAYRLVVEAPEEHHAAPTRLGPDAQLLKRLEHFIYDRPDHWYLWNELHHLDSLAAA